MKFAFLTSAGFASLYEDDVPAARVLEERGHSVTPLVWDKCSLGVLNAFDAVVMRTPWDWFTRTLEFEAFLERLGDVSTAVINPHSMMLEYYAKTYLRTLEQRGVPIVPTRWLTRDLLDTLPEVIRTAGWSRAVVKPTVSANSNDTFLFSPNEARRVMASLRQSANHGEYMVQPYLSEIEKDGEWSLVFFGGQFSHAVRKYPKSGDFRVQHNHGGRAVPHAASPTLIAQAADVIAKAVPGSTYARVDGVVSGGQFLLMELEVIEPELFFRADPAAPGRFADALFAAVTRA